VPNPFEQAFSRGFSFGGAATRVDPLAAFMPSAEMVQEERATLDKDEPNLFFKLLQIPDRIFGGQSLKALLAGDLRKAFLNNPLFQVLDALPGVDIVEDIDFAEVREAWGDKNTREGVGNFFLNLAGEVLTDPSSFLLPFGKLAEIGKMAPATAIQVQKGLLTQAVETGTRAMLTFKVPFTKAGFVVPTPKSFDLAVARGLEKWANFMSTNPVTGGVIKLFNPQFAAVGDVVDEATGEVITSGSVLRRQAAEAVKKDRMERIGYMTQFNNELERMYRKRGHLLRGDGDANKAIMIANELGLTPADSAAAIDDAIESGPLYARAKMRRDRLLGTRTGPLEADATKVAKARALADRMRNGDASAIDEWLAEFPDASLPAEARDTARNLGKARPVEDLGMDMRESATPIDVRIESASGMAISPMGRERSALAQETGSPVRGVLEKSKQEQKDLFRRLRERSDPSQITLDDVFEIAEQGRHLMERVGTSDVMSGLLNMMSEGYFPRITNPAVADAVDKQFFNRIKSIGGGGAHSFVESFMEGRKFTTMSTWDVIVLARELGTKYSGFKPFGSAVGNLASQKAHTVLARIFDSDFIRSIKGLPGGAEAAEFFNTNPMLAWYRRIEQGSRVRGKVGFSRTIFDVESPMVLNDDAMKDLSPELIQERQGRGLKAYITDDTGRTYTVSEAAPGQILGESMHDDLRARVSIAKSDLRDWTTDQVLTRKATDKQILDDIAEDMRVADLDDTELGRYAPRSPEGAKLQKATQADRAYEARLKSMREEMRSLKGEDRIRASNKIDEVMEQQDHFRARMAEMKKTLQDEAISIRAAREDFVNATKAGSQAGREKLAQILRDKFDAGQFQHELAIHRAHAERGALALDELAATNPELLEKIKARHGDLRVKWLDQGVANAIYGKDGMWEMLTKPDRLASRMRLFDGATWYWKAWTTLFPGFVQTRVRDVVTNMVLFMQGGASPKVMTEAFGDAMGVARAFSKGLRGDSAELAQKIIARPDGATMSYAEAIEHGQRLGILGSSFVRDEIIRSGNEELALASTPVRQGFVKRMLKPNPAENSLLQFGFRTAEAGDNWTKLSAFLERWKSGLSVEESADFVKSWSYDPSASNLLTSFERHKMRRLIPFYSWAKFALKTEINAYFTRPGTLSFWEKLMSSAKQASGMSPAEFEAIVPEFVKDNLGIQYRTDDEGNPSFLVLGGYVPFSDVSRLATAISDTIEGKPGNVLDYVGEKLNPMLKVPLEAALNRSFYTQREIERFPGESSEMFGITMTKRTKEVLRSLRFLNEVDRLNIVNATDAERFLRLGDAVDGRRQSGNFFERLIGGGFGAAPRTQQIDAEDQIRFQAAKTEAEHSKLRGLLRKKVEDGDKAPSQKDVETLKKLLARSQASQQVIEEIQTKYAVTPR
jgi:hypothetical protein